MRNTQKNPVETESALAFGNTPAARNATVNWYWADQFSTDLLFIIGQLDWKFIQYMGKVVGTYLTEISDNPAAIKCAVSANQNIAALSAFLKEHEPRIQEWNDIAGAQISEHHKKIALESRQINSKQKKNVQRKPGKAAPRKKSASRAA